MPVARAGRKHPAGASRDSSQALRKGCEDPAQEQEHKSYSGRNADALNIAPSFSTAHVSFITLRHFGICHFRAPLATRSIVSFFCERALRLSPQTDSVTILYPARLAPDACLGDTVSFD